MTAVPCLLLAHSAFYCVRGTSKPHINKFLLCLTLLLGAWMSLFCFPPTSGIVCKKRMIRSVTAEYCISSFSAIIGKSKPKPQHSCTRLHFRSLCLFCSLHSHSGFFSLGLFLSHISLSAVMHSLIHAPVFCVDHITGCSLFPPLHTALSCYSQFAASGWDFAHIVTHSETCRCSISIHTVVALKFHTGRHYELLSQVSTEQFVTINFQSVFSI